MNALAKIPLSVKPRPSRSEIIESLTILQVEKLSKERDELQDLADAVVQTTVSLVRDYLAKNMAKLEASLDVGHVYNEEMRGVQITFCFSDADIKAPLRAAILKAQQAREAVPREPRSHIIREQIKKGISLSIEERAEALLENADMREALETTLKALSSPKPIRAN